MILSIYCILCIYLIYIAPLTGYSSRAPVAIHRRFRCENPEGRGRFWGGRRMQEFRDKDNLEMLPV